MNAIILHQTRWFSIRQAASGEEFLASTGDEVVIVALDSAGNVLLSVEPSAAFGAPTLILPDGQGGPGVLNPEQYRVYRQKWALKGGNHVN